MDKILKPENYRGYELDFKSVRLGIFRKQVVAIARKDSHVEVQIYRPTKEEAEISLKRYLDIMVPQKKIQQSGEGLGEGASLQGKKMNGIEEQSYTKDGKTYAGSTRRKKKTSEPHDNIDDNNESPYGHK